MANYAYDMSINPDASNVASSDVRNYANNDDIHSSNTFAASRGRHTGNNSSFGRGYGRGRGSARGQSYAQEQSSGGRGANVPRGGYGANRGHRDNTKEYVIAPRHRKQKLATEEIVETIKEKFEEKTYSAIVRNPAIDNTNFIF